MLLLYVYSSLAIVTFGLLVRLFSTIPSFEKKLPRWARLIATYILFMDSFNDYYTVLGVAADASANTIKAAFKKLALKYHPDVYKGEDAEERMRVLLVAYQTLSDPVARKAYDAHRSEHILDFPAQRVRVDYNKAPLRKSHDNGEVSPAARRDRQRHYDFPDLSDRAATVQVNLGDISYRLSPDETRILREQGMLRGVANVGSQSVAPADICHRCHHRWTPTSIRGLAIDAVCPACKARDWREYLLLRCVHCRAVFESEQIRYEVGSYHYSDNALCPPYELFPLCPYCGVAGWCPAEDARVSVLGAEAVRRAAMLRLVLIGVVVVVAMLVLGIVLLNILR